MANKLFEKIESDALAKIDEIDAGFDAWLAQERKNEDFALLDVCVGALCDAFEAGKVDEGKFEACLGRLYQGFNIKESEYQAWCQQQDFPGE